MITCTIKLKEAEGGLMQILMESDSQKGTSAERQFAGALDVGVRATLVYLQRNDGKMVETKDMELDVVGLLERLYGHKFTIT